MAKLWGKEIMVDEQVSLLEDFSSYIEKSMLENITSFKSIMIHRKAGCLNEVCDFLVKLLPKVCDEVGKYLVKNKLMNPPNWEIFLKERLKLATEAGKLLHSYYDSCFQMCASQYTMQCQATYEQELAKQDGLGFGIISSSLAAHLVYAAQSVHKEKENEKRASEAAAKIMRSSSPIDRADQILISFYYKKFEPFAIDFIIGFYSDVEMLIFDGLGIEKETLDNNKVLSGNELLGITEENHRACITASLSKYPFNGDALFWAIRYNDVDELIEFCTANILVRKKYLYAIKQSAVVYLKKQKENADLYNRDSLTEDIVELLHRIKAFLSDERMNGASVYDNIIQEVYGETINLLCQKMDTLIKIKNSSSALCEYAKEHSTIDVSSMDLKLLQRFNAIFGIKKTRVIIDSLPNESEAFDEMLSSLRKEVKNTHRKHQEVEKQRQQREFELAEQKKKEIERATLAKKKQDSIVAIIVGCAILAFGIFLLALETFFLGIVFFVTGSFCIINGFYNLMGAIKGLKDFDKEKK